MELLTDLLASTVRLSTPIVFAAMGGFFCEKAGVVNIALEAIMLISAFGAAAVTAIYHDPYVGLVAGVLCGAIMSAIHALLCITFKTNQIISGTALNILSYGLPSVLCKAIFDVTTSTPPIPQNETFQTIAIPFISSVPFFGEVFAKHSILVYIALAAALFSHLVLYKTRFGLRMRAVGEHPKAANSAGINVNRIRFTAVMLGGMITALGGVFLSVGHASFFSREMTAGRGFIALAALILGNWKPIPVLLAAFLFGFADAVQIRLQGVTISGIGEIPVQFVQMIPYCVTLVILAGFIGQARPPKASGIPFEKEGVNV